MSVLSTKGATTTAGGRGWQVHPSAAATPLLALALLAATVALAEFGARAAFVRERLAAPSVGSPSRPLELQLAELQALAQKEGGMDCLFLGNSLVLFGLDPEAFATAYESASGQHIRCFNFAVPGVTVSGIVALARILAEDYHPRLIIYGVSARDFTGGVEAPAILETPWFRYRQGNFNIDGWLADHSYAYRYYLLYSHGMVTIEPALAHFKTKARRGFYPFTMTTMFDAAAVRRARAIAAATFGNAIDPQQLEAFNSLLSLPATDLQLALVEMPWHLAASEWTPDTATHYHQLMDDVAQRAQRSGAPYWETMSSPFVPDDGWVDLWHLNARGADVVSRWLSERVAHAVNSGALHLPHDTRPRPTP